MLLKEIIQSWKNPLEFDINYEIEQQDIVKILEAARWAPSAENQQVWRFLAINEEEKKNITTTAIEEQDPRLTSTLHEIKKPILRPSFTYTTENYNAIGDKYKGLIVSEAHQNDINCARTASVIIICTHRDTNLGKIYGPTDVGAAITNMTLVASDLGLGTRIIRNFNREILREKLRISNSKIIDVLLAIGKVKKKTEETELKAKNIKEFCFHDSWDIPLKLSKLKSETLEFQDYDVEAVDAIVDRRSIRKYYEEKSIPNKIISELIDASLMIPLIINKPYLKIGIIDDKKVLGEIAKHSKFVVQQSHVRQVPLAIVLAFDCSNNSPGFYAEIDTGAIIQNILLRAHSLGIGSCWIGAFNRENVRKILNIEDDWHIPSMAIFGYPKKYPKPTPRLNLGKIGYFNKWKVRIERRHRTLIPNYHIYSIAFRKIQKTKVETPLRNRRVGDLRGIPEFEKLM